MPAKKHLRGVNATELRQYEHIRESAQNSGRYGKRAAEVAARTVMKQREDPLAEPNPQATMAEQQPPGRAHR